MNSWARWSSKVKAPPNLVGHFLTYLTLTSISIAQPILQLYGENLTVFTIAKIGEWQVIGFAIFVILAPPLLLIVLETVAVAIYQPWQQIFHRVFIFLALWSVTMLISRTFSFYIWPLALLVSGLIALAMLGAYVALPAVGSWTRIMSPLGLIVFILFVIAAQNVIWVPNIGAADVFVNKEKESQIATPRQDVSVVFLILDEAPLFPLLDSEGAINESRFPGFASLADSGTWYRNNIASSQETIEALPSILSGVLPTADKEPLLADYPKNLFTLLGGNMAMDVQEIITSLCPVSLCEKAAITSGNEGVVPASSLPDGQNTSEPTESTSFSRFLLDTSIVLGHKLMPPGLRRQLPTIDEAWGNFGDMEMQVDQDETSSPENVVNIAPDETLPVINYESTEDIKLSKEKWRASGPVSQVLRIEKLIKRSSSQTIPTLHFAHVLLPHRPWKLSSDLRSSTKENFPPDNSVNVDASRDQYQKFLQQYVATDTLIGDLVAQLKASKNWNRTMLVVTSDHGITFEPGEHKRNVNPERSDTMEDLYKVPLFIKYPDQILAEISDCPVMAVDILPTIAAVKGLDAGWKFDGQNLRDQCPTRSSRSITWPGNRRTFVSDQSSLQNRVDKYSTWVTTGGSASAITPFGSLMNSFVAESSSVQEPIVTWTLDDATQFKDVKSARFAEIPLLIRGTIQVNATLPKDAVGLVLIDGRVSGMIGELSRSKAGARVPFVSVLEPSNLTKGAHEIALAIASGSPLSPTITFIGSPS